MPSGRRTHLSIALTLLLVGAASIAPASITANDPPVKEDGGAYPALDTVPPVDKTATQTKPGKDGTKGTGGLAPANRVGAAADSVIVEDGETQPVFSYEAAIRERVWVPVPGVDQNEDGIDDRVALDIIRPAETNAGLKVPAIIDVSPY